MPNRDDSTSVKKNTTTNVQTVPNHKIGTHDEWLADRLELLKQEKELTKRSDELAQLRQELPWVPVEKEYRLETADGTKTLNELFEGRSQLAIYHFMFGPDYNAGCPACSATADSFNGVLRHLNARDVTMICVSRAPIDKLLAYRKRMGWSFVWASSYKSDFNFDYGVSARDGIAQNSGVPLLMANELVFLNMLKEQPSIRQNLPLIPVQFAKTSGTDIDGYLSEGHGFSTFAREGGKIYHCYSTYTRGTEFLMGFYAILDRTPKGRDEGDDAMSWVRRYDEYES
jgi:predicted dithiol-disulfide oxidoreductase (DUF899 family)